MRIAYRKAGKVCCLKCCHFGLALQKTLHCDSHIHDMNRAAVLTSRPQIQSQLSKRKGNRILRPKSIAQYLPIVRGYSGRNINRNLVSGHAVKRGYHPAVFIRKHAGQTSAENSIDYTVIRSLLV